MNNALLIADLDRLAATFETAAERAETAAATAEYWAEWDPDPGWRYKWAGWGEDDRDRASGYRGKAEGLRARAEALRNGGGPQT